MIIDSKHLEEMIRFVKRTFSGSLFTEYHDIFYFKNDAGQEKALNIPQMTVFQPSDLDIRFVDAQCHGYLEKMTVGWRSFFSSTTKITWVKQYLVMRNDTIHVFEKDNFEVPTGQIFLEEYTLAS